VFAEWNKGELDSYLIDITSQIFAKKDEDGAPIVDKILDAAGQKGTGKWTCLSALDLGMPVTLIGEAVFSRCLSAIKDERVSASAILKGPRAPRPSFRPVKAFGFSPEKGMAGKALERNIRFLQIETGHQDTPVNADQAYLYFWPGGQTERASIQLSVGGSTRDVDIVSIVVSPFTGKADIKKGKIGMPRPRDDVEASERRDTGF